jgi:hypothetical protein
MVEPADLVPPVHHCRLLHIMSSFQPEHQPQPDTNSDTNGDTMEAKPTKTVPFFPIPCYNLHKFQIRSKLIETLLRTM